MGDGYENKRWKSIKKSWQKERVAEMEEGARRERIGDTEINFRTGRSRRI